MDQTGKKKPRGRPFGPNNPPPGGSQKGRKVSRAAGFLADMQWVLKNPTANCDGRRAALQEMFKDQKRWFMDKMASLETGGSIQAEEPVASGSATEGTGPGKADEGVRLVGELVDGLLREWEEEDGTARRDGATVHDRAGVDES